MAVKIFAIILFLFVLEIAFLTTHKPITLEIKNTPIDFSNVSFENIDTYIITKEGIKATLLAKQALAYDTRNELYNTQSTLYNLTHTDHIEADKAIQKGETLHMFGHIRYESNNSMLLKSDELVYNTKTQIVRSLSPFTMQHQKLDSKGESFVFDTIQNILHATYVTLTIEEEK